MIAQDAFLENETNEYADALLPAALWTESDGVMVNSERNLTLFQPAVKAPGQALPDWQIIARIACEMGFSESFSYDSRRGSLRRDQAILEPRDGLRPARGQLRPIAADPAAVAVPTRAAPATATRSAT